MAIAHRHPSQEQSATPIAAPNAAPEIPTEEIAIEDTPIDVYDPLALDTAPTTQTEQLPPSLSSETFVSSADTPPPLDRTPVSTEQSPQRKKASLTTRLLGAGVAVLAVAGIGFGAGRMLSDEEAPKSTPQEQPTPTTTGSVLSSTTTQPPRPEVTQPPVTAEKALVGKIDITEILPGEETISIPWNNTSIELARERDYDKVGIDAYTAERLNTLAAYYVTGDQRALDNLLPATAVKQRSSIQAERNSTMANIFSAYKQNPNVQITIFDDPEDPLVMREVSNTQGYPPGYRVLKMVDGTLYFNTTGNYGGKGEWQEDMARALTPNHFIFTELEFGIKAGPDGKTELGAIAYSFKPPAQKN